MKDGSALRKRKSFCEARTKDCSGKPGLTGEGDSGMGREGNAPIIKRERQNVI